MPQTLRAGGAMRKYLFAMPGITRLIPGLSCANTDLFDDAPAGCAAGGAHALQCPADAASALRRRATPGRPPVHDRRPEADMAPTGTVRHRSRTLRERKTDARAMGVA